MKTFVNAAVFGFLTGVVAAVGVDAAYSACENGCQESYCWIIFYPDDTSICAVHHDDEQGLTGAVAGDIGTQTGTGHTLEWDSCPSGNCFANCPNLSGETVFQAAGSSVQGCTGPFQIPQFTCDNP